MKTPEAKLTSTQRGSALIVVLLVLFMLILLAVAVTSISSTRSYVATEISQRVTAEALAEAGIGAKLEEIERTSGNNFDPLTLTTDQGTVTVTAVDKGNTVVQLIARAETRGGLSRFAIEAHLESVHHQAFYKAIYVGNKQNLPTNLMLGPVFQPDANPPSDAVRQDDWETRWEDDADYVDGDVWVNGKIMIKGDTLVFGDVDTTSTVDGGVAEGTITEGTSAIAPPNLEIMDYRNRPETVLVDDPTAIPADLQGVFFAGFDRDNSHYRGMAGNQEQERLFHLGRPTSGGGTSSTIQFNETHNGKIYYVQGNLWLHSDYDRILNLPDNQDIQVTIVVEGNLYISDDLNYGEDTSTGELTNSAVLFIVKGSDSDPESFHDVNRNYVYDGPQPGDDGIMGTPDDIPGETIINDRGTLGAYDGPHTEGQGNVYLGDARFGTGGVTHGYMYAQNCAYLLVPPVDDVIQADREKIYGVLGFLNAGQIFDLGEREKDAYYRSYKVKYDRRLQDGDVNLPGIPRGHAGGFDGLKVISWRVLPSS